VPGRKTDVKDAEWIADLRHARTAAGQLHSLGASTGTPGADALPDAAGGRAGARDQSAAKNAGRYQPQARRCRKSM
jgi:hypothetical protein